MIYAGQWGPEAMIDLAGNGQGLAAATLYESDGVTLATHYTDRTKTVERSNPWAADGRGNLTLYADPGPYVMAVTISGAVATFDIVVQPDPEEVADTLDAAAVDATVVHVAGAETITGDKYFTGIVQVDGVDVETIDGAAAKAAAAQAASQPLDADLTAIAAVATTSYGRALLALVDAAAARTALALGTAATAASTAFDPAGTGAAAAAAAAAASQPLDSDLTAIAALATTSYGRALLALADAAAARTALGLGTAATAAASSFESSGGASATDQVLKGWTSAEAYELLAITRDSDEVVTTATVKWPDGSAGTFTRVTKNATFLTVDAFTISHTTSGKTVTQAAVTRDAAGAVTTKPALTVA